MLAKDIKPHTNYIADNSHGRKFTIHMYDVKYYTTEQGKAEVEITWRWLEHPRAKMHEPTTYAIGAEATWPYIEDPYVIEEIPDGELQ